MGAAREDVEVVGDGIIVGKGIGDEESVVERFLWEC